MTFLDGTAVTGTAALKANGVATLTVAPAGPSGSNPDGGLLLALPLLGLTRGRRRMWVMVTILLGMALLLTACGVDGSDLRPGSPSGQYSITVTATTAAGATRTATLPLTVN